jgi:hypothetical protein
MGYMVTKWARQQPISRPLKTTLAAIADFADNDTGEAGVGIARIAANTGYNERTVRRHRDELVAAGLLDRRRGRLPGMRRVVDVLAFPGYLADKMSTRSEGVSSGHSDPDLPDISTASSGHSEHSLYIEEERSEKGEQRKTRAGARDDGPPPEVSAEEFLRISPSRSVSRRFFDTPENHRFDQEEAELEKRREQIEAERSAFVDRWEAEQREAA